MGQTFVGMVYVVYWPQVGYGLEALCELGIFNVLEIQHSSLWTDQS